jgi:IclR family acetate operon transcriptional repressor
MASKSIEAQESGNGAEAPRAVLRILNILNCVAETPTGCTLSLISREMDIPKSSLSNLLKGLVNGGYLTNNGGIYALGGESYGLASAIIRSDRLPEISRSVLRRLAVATGETAIVSVLTPDDRVMYVDQVVSNNIVNARVWIGETRPLYSSAGGRVILAFFPPEKLKSYLNEIRLEKATEFTEIRRPRLKAILADIRETRYAVTVDEADMGLAGIAAPILNSSGVAVGSVILGGPTERFQSGIDAWIPLVVDAGKELSRFRGYTPGSI